jgi:hypothetical protein
MASMRRIAALSSTVLVVGCFKPSDDDVPADTEASTSSADDDATMTDPTATNPTADDAPTEASMTADDDDDSSSASVSVSATSPTSNDATDSDGDTTMPTTLDTSGTTDSTTEPPAECGNGVVEDGENCDDGVNAGADVGDCAPDCSTEVEIREIVLSSELFTGDLAGAGPGSVIENADDGCPFGYRAMFADGADRIASVTANTGDGQVDWVLRPWTAYVNEDGDLLAITDAAALLGVHDGVFANLTNAIDPGNNGGTWTGLNQDWTAMPANENCNNWTNATNSYQMMQGISGQVTPGFLRQSQDFTYGCSDQGFTRPLYCAEE